MLAAKRPFILVVGDKGVLLVPPYGCSRSSSSSGFLSLLGLSKPPAFSAPFYITGHSEDAALEIKNLIESYPRIPVLILADTMAQDFKHMPMPRLWPWDRKKLLARRLRDTFPDAFLRGAFEANKGNILLASIPLQASSTHELRGINSAAPAVQPVPFWYEKCAAFQNEFWGVSLLPLESSSMLHLLDQRERKTNWVLLLSWQRTGGFRQIVLKNNQFIFTRLTPPLSFVEPSPAYIAAALSLDIQSTRDYLTRMGLSKDTPLHMIGILPENLHASLSTSLLPVQTKELLSPCEAAKRLGLSHAPVPQDPTCDVVHALWAMNRAAKKGKRLAKEETFQKLRNAIIRRRGYVCALVLWLALAATTASKGWDLAKETEKVVGAQNQIATLQKNLSTIQTELAPITEPLGRLRLAVERKRLFEPEAPAPLDLAQSLSETLGPRLRLIEFSWQKTDGTTDDATNGNAPNENGANNTTKEILHIVLRPTIPDYAKMSTEAQRILTTEIYSTFQKNLEEKLTSLSGAKYKLHATLLPFNNDPGSALSNGIKIEDSGKAEFEIYKGEFE